MAGVPTLVWNRGYAQIGEYKVVDEQIAAPYLVKECGSFFKEIAEFGSALNDFLDGYSKFTPRDYSLQNFTVEKSAQNYLNIIQGK
jgi:hypothetical protein